MLTGLAFSALCWLAACHHPPHPGVAPPADGEELTILQHIQGTHSHETRPMRLVIRDTSTLAQVPLTAVTVDFNKEMLLVVTLGRVTSDQVAVAIRRVWRERGRLKAEIDVTPPPRGAPLAMSTPFCVAVIPRCDLNVEGFSVVPPARERSWEQSPPPEGWDRP